MVIRGERKYYQVNVTSQINFSHSQNCSRSSSQFYVCHMCPNSRKIGLQVKLLLYKYQMANAPTEEPLNKILKVVWKTSEIFPKIRNFSKNLKSKVAQSISGWVSEWQGHLLSCCGQLKNHVKIICIRIYRNSILTQMFTDSGFFSWKLLTY